MRQNPPPDAGITLVAAAALVRADGRILMQQRPVASQHGGLWEFPGGKREAGESLTSCLARELAEELSITVAPSAMHYCAAALVPRGDGGELLLALFVVDSWTGDAAAAPGAALAWVEPEDIAALPMPPADGPLADALVRYLSA